jgi:hypothetical protein
MKQTGEIPSGWVPKGDGWYTTDMPKASVTTEFTNFAEQSRARWDLIGWLRVKIHQKLQKATPPAKV